MNDKKPINLHFFSKEHLDKFSNIATANEINMSHVTYVENEGWYVATEPITNTARRKVIGEWARVSIEIK